MFNGNMGPGLDDLVMRRRVGAPMPPGRNVGGPANPLPPGSNPMLIPLMEKLRRGTDPPSAQTRGTVPPQNGQRGNFQPGGPGGFDRGFSQPGIEPPPPAMMGGPFFGSPGTPDNNSFKRASGQKPIGGSGFNPYAAGRKQYGASPNRGPMRDKTPFQERDLNAINQRNAMLKRLKARGQGRFMTPENLRD